MVVKHVSAATKSKTIQNPCAPCKYPDGIRIRKVSPGKSVTAQDTCKRCLSLWRGRGNKSAAPNICMEFIQGCEEMSLRSWGGNQFVTAGWTELIVTGSSQTCRAGHRYWGASQHEWIKRGSGSRHTTAGSKGSECSQSTFMKLGWWRNANGRKSP